MAWMYILKCEDGTYYTGSTIDLERRVAEHACGLGARYTAARRPVELVYACGFQQIEEAYQRENQVKDWNRAKKEALIRGDFDGLQVASRASRQARRTTGTTGLGEPLFEPVENSGDGESSQALEQGQERSTHSGKLGCPASTF